MIRIVLDFIIAVLYFTDTITVDLALIILLVLDALIITSLSEFYPLYIFLGIKNEHII
jgi:hypothetical protein